MEAVNEQIDTDSKHGLLWCIERAIAARLDRRPQFK